MPVKRIKPEPEEHPDLVDTIARVLSENKPTGPAEDPDIRIEEIKHSNSLHVIVVWDDWAGIDAEERGRIILDAVAKALGEGVMLRVTMAFGLTREEARRMNMAST